MPDARPVQVRMTRRQVRMPVRDHFRVVGGPEQGRQYRAQCRERRQRDQRHGHA